MKTFRFSIEVQAENESEACEKFRDENIIPEDMNIEAVHASTPPNKDGEAE